MAPLAHVNTRRVGRTPYRLVPVMRQVVAVCCSLLALASQAEFTSPTTGILYQHGIAYLDELSYPADFTHLRYHNPDAPKGGRMRIGEMGNWDSFIDVPFTGREVRGVHTWEVRWNYIYDRLLSHALDTESDRYGQLAEGIAVAEDGAWIAFKLRPGAYWHDGTPITTDDYVFSFNVYTQQAKPSIRQPMAVFERLEVLNESEIRVWVVPEERGNPALPARIGTVPILPAHYWASRDITKPTLEPPLASGPYRVDTFKLGRQVVYQRVKDYWGKDIPVNRGRFNFDTLVIDYFRDDQVQYEAVKGDVIDIREETVPARWATGYDFAAVQAGRFNVDLIKQLKPAGLWWPIFWNLRQKRFQDIRVRRALWLLRDPEWGNRTGGFGFYDQATSYFHDSKLAHRGVPSGRELALLEPFRSQVPPEVFTKEFSKVPHSGSGWNRERVREALELFEAAGWVIRNNRLVRHDTGEPFDIRFVAVSRALGASWITYANVLRRVGIESSITAPEISGWLHRMRTGDFDGGSIWFLPTNTPMLQVMNQFHSSSAEMDYGPNWTHIKNPAVDAMVEHAAKAKSMDDFVASLRALDRVLLWNYYFIPSSSRTQLAMCYWDRFSFVDAGRLGRDVYHSAWWWDEAKATRVAQFQAGESVADTQEH